MFGQYTLFRSFRYVSAIPDVQMSHDHEHFGEVVFLYLKCQDYYFP